MFCGVLLHSDFINIIQDCNRKSTVIRLYMNSSSQMGFSLSHLIPKLGLTYTIYAVTWSMQPFCQRFRRWTDLPRKGATYMKLPCEQQVTSLDWRSNECRTFSLHDTKQYDIMAEENVPPCWLSMKCIDWFPSQRTAMQIFDVSISCSTYHTNEQTVGLPVIWYFMEFILGHNNVRNYVWNYPCLPAIQNILSNRHSNIFISHMSKLIRG